MNILFSSQETIAKNRTIGSTEFKKYYPGINISMSWDELAPHMEAATIEYILPYLGSELYEAIYQHSQSTTIDPIKDRLVDLLKRCVAHYTIYVAAPHLNVTISDLGLRENSNESSTPISQWKYKALRWSVMTVADSTLDTLLEYIEDNIDNAFFAVWKTSQAKDRYTHWLFPYTRDLQEYLSISGRRAYLALLPYLRAAEDKMTDLLCIEYATLKAKVIAGTTQNDTDTALLTHIKKLIAKMAMLDGSVHLSMIYDGSGYKLASSMDSYDQRSNVLASSNKEWLQALQTKLEEDVQLQLNRLDKMLYADPDAYPLWKEAKYVEDDNQGIIVSDDCIGGLGVF